ncbi:DUF5615 family PIN-like protein [Pedobacter psychrophilus]|uniref:DUF5615 family PIN-like protein n=1 Tax=Pedobacter psychrophilus TaxID=1826909 RepID=UPI00373FC6A6
MYKGFDAVHTLDLPNQNFTDDNEILKFALEENRIVITKDSDFLDSYLLKSEPKKLLLIRTGNITNQMLLKIFSDKLEIITKLISESNLVEVTQNFIIQHK